MTNWVSRALTGEMLARTETPDEINARVFADNRDMPLETVLAAFEAGFPPLEALLNRLTDDEINDAEVCDIRGMPLLYFIVGNTFAHYADHIDDLRAYVERLGTRDYFELQRTAEGAEKRNNWLNDPSALSALSVVKINCA